MSKAPVTISIVTYNSAEHIKRCLDAVYAQDYPCIRILVIDNNSNDSTIEIINVVNANASHAGVEIVQTCHNLGYGGGHNLIRSLTDTPYVLFLNPDVCLDSTFVSENVKYLETHREIAVVGGKLFASHDRQNLDGFGVDISRSRKFLLYAHQKLDDSTYSRPQEVFAVDGAAMFARRQALEDIATNGQWFDETFFLHKEDLDLCWRLRHAGWKCAVNPLSTGIHPRTFRPSDRQLRRRLPSELTATALRNQFALLIKNERIQDLLRDFPWIIIRHISILIYAVIFEPKSINALLQLWRDRSDLLKKRRQIQSNSNPRIAKIRHSQNRFGHMHHEPYVLFISNICRDYRVKAFEELAYRCSTRFVFYSQGEESYQRNTTHISGEFHETRLRGINLLPNFKIVPTLIPILFFWRYDVVIKCINGRFVLPVTYLLARLRCKPFILWTGLWMKPRTFFHRFFSFATTWIYRHADSIIVYGPHVKDFLIKEGVLPDRIHCALQAQDNEFFMEIVSAASQKVLRTRYCIPDGNTLVAYVGRITSEKGLDYLINAWEQLKPNNATLILVGDGDLKRIYDTRYAYRPENIILTGALSREDLRTLYSIIDILVLPSINTHTFKEPWGFVINEAMAQSTAIIATEVVGAVYGGLVREGKNGMIVPERDASALREAINNLLNNMPVLNLMKQQSKEIITYFTYSQMVDGFEAAIRQVTQMSV